MIQISVVRATVLTGRGQDRIELHCNVNGYEFLCDKSVPAGTGESWLSERMPEVQYEVIKMPEHKFEFTEDKS